MQYSKIGKRHITLLKGTVCNWIRRKRKKVKPIRSVSKSSNRHRHGVNDFTNNKINKEERSVKNTVVRYLTYVRLKIHIEYTYVSYFII
jgi:hypothetical protein